MLKYIILLWYTLKIENVHRMQEIRLKVENYNYILLCQGLGKLEQTMMRLPVSNCTCPS